MSWNRVAESSELEAGKVIVVEIGETRLAVCRTNNGIYAIDDLCTHDGGPLDQGELIGEQIECPRHGARFDVTSGKALTLPAVRPVKTYPVREQDGKIEVELS